MKNLFYLLGAVIMFSSSCSKEDKKAPDTNTSNDILGEGWSAVNGFDTGSTINDVFFSDAMNGFLCGSAGIFKSADGGNNWTLIPTEKKSYYNIGAYSVKKAIFVGGNNSIALYNDGVMTESNISIDPTSDLRFGDACFIGNDVCYLTSRRYLWKSSNGGIDFDTLYNFNKSTDADNSLYFLNNTTGWVNRDDSLYKTNDAGSTWNFVFSPGVANKKFQKALQYVDNLNGFVVLGDNIYKTNDGGISFTKIFTFSGENISGYDLSFFNATSGYISGDNCVYKTTDGGANWERVVKIDSSRSILEIHFVDENNGWVCGSKGLLLKYSKG